MSAINQLICSSTLGNSGVPGCFYDPKNMIGAFLVPKGDEIDVATLQTALIAKTHLTSASRRWYPWYDFETTTDATEAKVIQTMPTGQKHVVREGFNDWKFQYVDGGLSLHLEARQFNGDKWDFIFVDGGDPSRGQALIGIKGSTDTKLKGIPVSGGFFWADPFKLNDGSKITEYTLQFIFDSRYMNTKGLTSFVVADFDIPTTVKGLQDIVLSEVTSAVPGTYNIKAVTGATGSNLGELYSTELASAALWTAVNGTTGAAITISSVTYNATTGAFGLVLSQVDTDYPADGDPILINLASPSVLQAAGIDGYESTGAISVDATSTP